MKSLFKPSGQGALKSILAVSIIVITSLLMVHCTSQKEIPNDGNGAYTSGIYRNLFLENGYTQEDITAKVNAAFQQLFYGDTSQRLYFDAGANGNGPKAYLCDVLHNDVRSEGMSYGMMVCVQMDKKAEFDALWNWAMTHMYVRKTDHPSQGYFAWSVRPDGIPLSEGPAPDGEEYFVMSLYFAANRWGNGEGIYNYKAYADTILTTMRHREVKTGNTISGPRTTGPMVNEEACMILFVPDEGGNTFSDPSYHLPAFYELWARWGPEADRDFWAAAADTSRRYFTKACHPVTGLCTDYANFDGTPKFVEWNPNSENFAYDSWRTASNWAVDWSWWQKDPSAQELSNRIQSFFAEMGVTTYGHVFKQTGEVINPMHRIGLASANATASLAATNPIAREFVDDFWNSPVPTAFDQRYYDGTLYLLNILHCSGEFKIWKPKNKE